MKNKIVPLGQFRRIKDAETNMYDCLRCLGCGKLEVSRKGVWYCHKCGRGGKTKPIPRPFFGECEKQLNAKEFTPLDFLDSRWLGFMRNRNLSAEHHAMVRPHVQDTKRFVFSPVYEDWLCTQPVAWMGKPIQGKGFHLTSGEKSKGLWGLHLLRLPVHEVTIVEGMLDALWGRNRLALGGTVLSQCQLEILKKIQPQRIHVMLDGDAESAAWSLCEKLIRAQSWGVSLVCLPPDKDPDDMRSGMVKRNVYALS